MKLFGLAIGRINSIMDLILLDICLGDKVLHCEEQNNLVMRGVFVIFSSIIWYKNAIEWPNDSYWLKIQNL